MIVFFNLSPTTTNLHILFFFKWSMIVDHHTVGYFCAVWNCSQWNRFHCVGANDTSSISIHQLVISITTGYQPCRFIKLIVAEGL